MLLNKESFRFAVLYDGSGCAINVLKETLTMMGERDRLMTITAKQLGPDYSIMDKAYPTF